MSETHVRSTRLAARDPLTPSINTGSRNTIPRRVLAALLNVLVGCVVAAVLAGVTAFLFGAREQSIAIGAGALLVLAIAYARLAPVERERSWQPVRDMLCVGAVALVAMALSGQYATADLRMVAAAVAAAAVTSALWVAIRRLRLRRQSVLLVGDRLAVAQCIEHWAGRPTVDIRGVCLVEAPHEASDRPGEVLGIPVVGTLDDTAQVATTWPVDEVVVAPGPLVTAYDVRRIGWALERTRVRVSVTAEVHGAAPHRVRPRLVGRRVVLDVAPSVRPRLQRVAKASVDRIVGMILLGLFAPLIGVLALVVRIDSPGPAMFRQVRAGRNGEPFTMYKLRTMCDDAESLLAELVAQNEGAGPLFKMNDDPRVTRIGRFLRRTSLDELPQLINVVKGEMSLIGPRPSLLPEVASYDEWVARRLSVKPGMTGLWQVSGRSKLNWNDTVGLDLGYVDNWTPGGDLAIAVRTVKAVLKRDGAA